MKFIGPLGLALAATLGMHGSATGQRPPPMPREPTVKARLFGPAPTGLQVSYGNPGALLVWEGVTDPAGYRVYRTTDPSIPATELTTAPITEGKFSDLTAIAGGVYYYSVSADYLDMRLGTSAPVGFGVPTMNRSGQLVYPPMATFTGNLPVSAPVNLLAQSRSPIEVSLTWQGPISAASYEVRRAEAYDPPLLLTPSPLRDPAFIDQGVSPQTTYLYTVTAVGTGGDRASTQTGATTPRVSNPTGLTSSVQLATVPVQFTPTLGGRMAVNGAVTLSWQPVPGATGYQVAGPNVVAPYRLVTGTSTTVGPVPPSYVKYTVVAEFTNNKKQSYGLIFDPAWLTLQVGPQAAERLHTTTPGQGVFEWSDGVGTLVRHLLYAERPAGPWREVPEPLSPYGARHHEVADSGRTFWYKVVSNFAGGLLTVSEPYILARQGQFSLLGLEIVSTQRGAVRIRWYPIMGASYTVTIPATGVVRALVPGDWINAEFVDQNTTSGGSYGYNVCATAIQFYGVYPATRCAQITVAVP